MKCPKCTGTLAPTKLEPSLAARTCTACEGTVLDLVAWRLWRERQPQEAEVDAGEPEVEPTEAHSAVLCPGCGRIMSRFRYTTDTAHVLDVCSSCDLSWLQANEWAFLKTRELAASLTQIFTDPWQRALREERTRQTLDAHWDEQLGPEAHAEVREVRAWLDAHPAGDALRRYLTVDDPYAT